jgi:hypothetical protein
MIDAVQFTGQSVDEIQESFGLPLLNGILAPHGTHKDKFLWVMGCNGGKWQKCWESDWILSTDMENRFVVKRDSEYTVYRAMLKATEKIKPTEYFDEETPHKVYGALLPVVGGEVANELIAAMENAGILFREFKQ